MFSYLCRKITFKQLVFTKLIFVFPFGWVKKTNQQFHREQLTTEKLLTGPSPNIMCETFYTIRQGRVSEPVEKTSQDYVYSRLLRFVAIIYDVILKTRWMCFCDCSYTTGSRGAVSPVSSANRQTGGRKRISQKLRDCARCCSARAFKHGTLEHQLWTLTLTPSCLCTVISSEVLFFSAWFWIANLFHLTLAC